MDSRRKLSAVILAGGLSRRMGSEKAFLLHEGQSFISSVASEMSKASDDVIVMIGRKRKEDFEPAVPEGVRILRDDDYLGNPVGGIRSAFEHVKHADAAVVACDSPLVKAEVIRYLAEELQNHSATVPLWEEEDKTTMEPLCAVYAVAETKTAIQQTIKEGNLTPKRVVFHLKDVLYIDVSRLRLVDPRLDSLVNVNTRSEYAALERREDSQAPAYPGFSGVA